MQNNQLLHLLMQDYGYILPDGSNSQAKLQDAASAVARSSANSLRQFIYKAASDDSKGLWWEIHNLPDVASQLFDQYIVASFKTAYQQIDKEDLLKSLCLAACTIFQGCKNFLEQMQEHLPQLSKITILVLKLALSVAICSLAPYLTPLAASVVLNSDVLFAQATKLFSAIVAKEQALAEVPSVAGNIMKLAQCCDIDVVFIAQLGLSSKDLQLLVKNQVRQEYLLSFLELNALAPLAFSLNDQGLSKQLENCLDDSLMPAFTKWVAPVLENRAALLQKEAELSLFDKIAINSDALNNKIAPAVKRFLQEVPSQMRDQVGEQMLDVIKDAQKPLLITKELIALNPDLTKALGLSAAGRYLIEKSSAAIAISYAQ